MFRPTRVSGGYAPVTEGESYKPFYAIGYSSLLEPSHVSVTTESFGHLTLTFPTFTGWALESNSGGANWYRDPSAAADAYTDILKTVMVNQTDVAVAVEVGFSSPANLGVPDDVGGTSFAGGVLCGAASYDQNLLTAWYLAGEVRVAVVRGETWETAGAFTTGAAPGVNFAMPLENGYVGCRRDGPNMVMFFHGTDTGSGTADYASVLDADADSTVQIARSDSSNNLAAVTLNAATGLLTNATAGDITAAVLSPVVVADVDLLLPTLAPFMEWVSGSTTMVYLVSADGTQTHKVTAVSLDPLAGIVSTTVSPAPPSAPLGVVPGGDGVLLVLVDRVLSVNLETGASTDLGAYEAGSAAVVGATYTRGRVVGDETWAVEQDGASYRYVRLNTDGSEPILATIDHVDYTGSAHSEMVMGAGATAVVNSDVQESLFRGGDAYTEVLTVEIEDPVAVSVSGPLGDALPGASATADLTIENASTLSFLGAVVMNDLGGTIEGWTLSTSSWTYQLTEPGAPFPDTAVTAESDYSMYAHTFVGGLGGAVENGADFASPAVFGTSVAISAGTDISVIGVEGSVTASAIPTSFACMSPTLQCGSAGGLMLWDQDGSTEFEISGVGTAPFEVLAVSEAGFVSASSNGEVWYHGVGQGFPASMFLGTLPGTPSNFVMMDGDVYVSIADLSSVMRIGTSPVRLVSQDAAVSPVSPFGVLGTYEGTLVAPVAEGLVSFDGTWTTAATWDTLASVTSMTTTESGLVIGTDTGGLLLTQDGVSLDLVSKDLPFGTGTVRVDDWVATGDGTVFRLLSGSATYSRGVEVAATVTGTPSSSSGSIVLTVSAVVVAAVLGLLAILFAIGVI